MEVQINEWQSTIRAVDNDSLLAPQQMAMIVRTVLQAVDERDAHRERVRAEQRITSGINQELEERW